MIKKIISIILAAVIFTVTAYAQTAELKAGQSTGGGQYKSVRLTPEVLNAANADLSDIRVKDSKGADVPYFIDESEIYTAENAESCAMELLNAYTKNDKFYMDYKLAEQKDGDALATALVLTTENTSFAKDITLYGGYDNEHWEKVLDDVIYKVEDKANLEIAFPQVEKYTHYRIELANNLEKIKFGAVSLQFNREELREGRSFLEELTPSFTVEEDGRETLLHIRGLKNLEFADIKIEAGGMWKRSVTAPLGVSKELYNLSFEDVEYNDTTLVFNHKIAREDVFTIRISNHDDKPINITGVKAGYYTRDIVFAAGEETSFTLHFSGDASAVAPVYDIASYKDEILKGKLDSLQLGAIVATPEPEPVKSVNYTLIFNVVIAVIALLLGVLILIKLRKAPK